MSDLENKETCQETASVTSVRISDDVVATIAAIAAGEIDGGEKEQRQRRESGSGKRQC